MLEYTGKYGKAKVMIDELDTATISQIYQFLNHEAFTNPISIMPDTHKGMGTVIGFTMEMTDKIIPNVVGVDIGCFVGDTKIPLLNGLQYTLSELENKECFYVYSMDKNLQIVPGKATCIKTRENTKLIEVVISGGESIKCTPDHKFMLTDGTYKEAQHLIPKRDSLMPLYRSYQTRDGYETVYSVHSRAKNTHRIVAEYFLGACPNDNFAHHINENWYDNSPENIEYIHKNKHSSIHASRRKTFISEEFKKNKKKTIEERGYYFHPKYKKKKQKISTQNIKNYIENNREEWLEKIKDNGKRGKKYLRKLNKIYVCEVCNKSCGNLGAYKRHKKIHKVDPNNHKVLFVRQLDIKEDVYCLQVEEYHNFALSAGVFVHNCGMYAMEMETPVFKEATRKVVDGAIRTEIPFGKNVREVPYLHLLTDHDFDNITAQGAIFTDQFNQKYGTRHYPISYNREWLKEKCAQIGIEYDRALKSIASLGGGNHFIEIGKSEKTKKYWITIHSGSRQFGLKVANYWQKKAGKGQLAYLQGDDMFGYLSDMFFAQTYASINRKSMARIIQAMFGEISQGIETVHNFIDFRDFIIRKGAISAYDYESMVIPFNMEDGILLCYGKSNAEWNYSAPHGAGRIGPRSKAKEDLKKVAKDIKHRMEKKGIYFSKLPLDEAKEAYKDSKIIEDAIEPTAEIFDRIKPVLAMKD